MVADSKVYIVGFCFDFKMGISYYTRSVILGVKPLKPASGDIVAEMIYRPEPPKEDANKVPHLELGERNEN